MQNETYQKLMELAKKPRYQDAFANLKRLNEIPLNQDILEEIAVLIMSELHVPSSVSARKFDDIVDLLRIANVLGRTN